MVRIKIYVEGGGERKDLKSKCREGFRKFFERAGLKGRMLRIIACGGRRSAYDDFCTALRLAEANEFIALLVDSEGPVADGIDPWFHLSSRQEDGWVRPGGAESDNVHLMVQCMESWFLADKDVLRVYFGQRFRDSSLPANPNIEGIPMADVLNALRNASRNTRKGSYNKGGHSFAILAQIDPSKVQRVSPYANRLIDMLAQTQSRTHLVGDS